MSLNGERAFQRQTSFQIAAKNGQQTRGLSGSHNGQYSERLQYTNDASLDYMNMEARKLASSSTHMDEIIEMGHSSLQELAAQRHMLKGTQRRLLDIANSLGLSQSAMRFIERRGTADKYILYGGMLATLLVIMLLVYFL